jgi:hypothetical protein
MSPLLNACSWATSSSTEGSQSPSEADATIQVTLTAAQPVTRESPMAQVAFVKTQDRADGVNKALDLLGIHSVQGKDLFVKPNFNSADAPPGSTESL